MVVPIVLVLICRSFKPRTSPCVAALLRVSNRPQDVLCCVAFPLCRSFCTGLNASAKKKSHVFSRARQLSLTRRFYTQGKAPIPKDSVLRNCIPSFFCRLQRGSVEHPFRHSHFSPTALHRALAYFLLVTPLAPFASSSAPFGRDALKGYSECIFAEGTAIVRVCR